MLYNAMHKQLAHTRKIMRLRAYITPCMYFPAFPRSSPSAQKKRTMIISRTFCRIQKKRVAYTREKEAETSRSNPATSACFSSPICAHYFCSDP